MLSEEQWAEVFEARCRAKRGLALSPAEQRLLADAYRADPERYKALGARVFDATHPAGPRLA